MKKPTKAAAGIHYAPIIPRERMYSNGTPQQREGVRNLAKHQGWHDFVRAGWAEMKIVL